METGSQVAGLKLCYACRRTKPLGAFNACASRADGRQPRCRDCRRRAYASAPEKGREQARRWRAAHLEQRRAYDRAYSKRRERPAEKLRAKSAVLTAVRNGSLKRKPCERCGARKVEAHHPDYARPLLVEWLCRRCHCAEHRKYKSEEARA